MVFFISSLGVSHFVFITPLAVSSRLELVRSNSWALFVFLPLFFFVAQKKRAARTRRRACDSTSSSDLAKNCDSLMIFSSLSLSG